MSILDSAEFASELFLKNPGENQCNECERPDTPYVTLSLMCSTRQGLLAIAICEELYKELSNPHVGGIPVDLGMPKKVDCNVWQTNRMGGGSKTKWHFRSLGKPFRQSGDEISALKYVSHSNEMRNDQANLAFDACVINEREATVG